MIILFLVQWDATLPVGSPFCELCSENGRQSVAVVQHSGTLGTGSNATAHGSSAHDTVVMRRQTGR